MPRYIAIAIVTAKIGFRSIAIYVSDTKTNPNAVRRQTYTPYRLLPPLVMQ